MISNSLWTPEQAAAFLGLTPDDLRDMRRRRQLPFLKLSDRRYRFDPAEIHKWLETKRVPPLS